MMEDGRWELWVPTYWLSANGINQWLNKLGTQNG